MEPIWNRILESCPPLCGLNFGDIPDSISSLRPIQQWDLHRPDQTTFIFGIFPSHVWFYSLYLRIGKMLDMLGIGEINTASARSNMNGYSILHLVAFIAGRAYSPRRKTTTSGSVDRDRRYSESCEAFKQLLRHGADLFLKDEYGSMPFDKFMESAHPIDHLKAWVDLLASYDISVLDDWLATEPEIYRDAPESWIVCGRTEHFDSMDSQHQASNIELRATLVIQQHKLHRRAPPGAWTTSWDCRIPDVICWNPCPKDLEHGHLQVRSERSVNARSNVLTVETLSQRVEDMSADSYQVPLGGSKDDASQQPLLLTGWQTCRERRRTSSQPPSRTLGGTSYFGSRFPEAYLNGFLVHLCAYDSRRRICTHTGYDRLLQNSAVNVRSCCAGPAHSYDVLDFEERYNSQPLSKRLGLQCMHCSPRDYGAECSSKWTTLKEAQTWRCERHETWASS